MLWRKTDILALSLPIICKKTDFPANLPRLPLVAIKILDLDPLLQQYYHFSPFHKSTTLALKNFFPYAPFGFINSLYLFVSTNIALLDANSTNLFLLVFLVQWFLVLRLQLSLLCSLKPPSPKLQCC